MLVASQSPISLLALTLVTLVLGCSKDEQTARVRFDGPTAEITGVPPSAAALRLGVASTHSPGPAMQRLAALADYLAKRLGRPVELVLRKTYHETNELLYQGKVDLAMLCSGAYAIARDGHGVTALVVPRVDGATTYHALLIARTVLGIGSLEDLRGRVFAFTDPLSNTGHRYALERLLARGEKPGSFFARSFFTYSHDNSIVALRDGLADGASVDELVWNEVVRADPKLAAVISVIERSEPFPINPVAMRLESDPRLRDAVRTAFLEMHADPDGRRVLDALAVEAFVPAIDADYAGMTESWSRLRAGPSGRAP